MDDAPTLPAELSRRLEGSFARGSGHGLLHLGAAEVEADGRKIARTFWGEAWCENLERYSDFANGLPRGRTYVRNGSVVDLQIAPGAVTALVSGSDIYKIEMKVASRKS